MTDEQFQETTLDNGVRVLSETIPGVRSLAVGIWVRRGSAHERLEHLGVSHLLEHMVFKGTERRSAHELALSLESLGGSLDAYTTREHTAYQARVLDTHLGEALDVLSDLVRRPALREEDLALERQVILEEIAQVEDAPDELAFELHGEMLWDGHPYGRSILGTPRSVSGIDTATLRALHGEAYRARNLVVAAAGRVEHGDLVARARAELGDLEGGTEPPLTPPVVNGGRAGEKRIERATTQTHVVFGGVGPAHADADRYPAILLSSALGGGMSSRLFQRVREAEGLCYTVFTWHSFWGRAGVVGTYLSTRPATEDRAVEVVQEELRKVAEEGLPPDELAQTKQQVKGQVMLSLESTGARLHRLAAAGLHDEDFRGLDELLGRIDAVTEDDVRRVAERHFAPEGQLVLRLGPA